MSHNECTILYVRLEMTRKQFCEIDTCLGEKWHQFLKFMRREEPGTESDADDFFDFIAQWVNDFSDETHFWVEGFDMAVVFENCLYE